MPTVYIGIGSNLNRETNVSNALVALKELFGTLRISSIYESEPIGFSGQPFYNLVVSFDTSHQLDSLYNKLKQIEKNQNRQKGNNLVSIDLDILLFGNVIDSKIKLPRPDVLECAFVLRPLSEISANLKHPVLNKCFKDLWDDFPKDEHPLKEITSSTLTINN